MANGARWTEEQIGDLSGKVVVVTGANSGIGYEAARLLTIHGAHVVFASRSRAKAEEAMQSVRRDRPKGSVELLELDLASLASIRAFAEAFRAKHEQLDVLCNNAGVMALPLRHTADGHEMQLGTNHLGHFALTGLLLDRLLGTGGSRVVTVSSYVHHQGRIDFEDLQGERGYRRWAAYAQSKLANLLFAFELDRRLRSAGRDLISVSCHPGYSATNLQTGGARLTGSSVKAGFMRFANALLAQSAAKGSLPTVCAAVGADVQGGDFIGPCGPLQMWGGPVKVGANKRAHDRQVAARLWRVSEELTGVRFEGLES